MSTGLKKAKRPDKRTMKRLPTSFFVKFVHKNSVNYGLVKNVSEKGMCISTGSQFPADTEIALLLPTKKSHIELPVMIRWSKNTFDFYDSMGVELLKPSSHFRKLYEYIESLH